MSAPCIDVPGCGCCTLQADTEPPEELDDVLDDDDLAADLILDHQERSDFAQDDLA